MACPYKAATPEQTIQKIRTALIDNGIFTTEHNWWNHEKKYYSVRVMVKDTLIGANGKGKTAEYALASAYAEFMERLQNYILYPRSEYDRATLSSLGFVVGPDEKVRSMKKAAPLPDCFRKADFSADGKSVYDHWAGLKDVWEGPDPLVYVPYANLLKQETEMLPYSYLSNIYRSNGMCAGNTHEESLVQGLAEIFERYAQKRLYFDGLVPPTVPDEFLAVHAPRQLLEIKDLEKNSGYRIIVKDCSMGQGVPVVGTIIVDLERNRYMFKLGAEPIFSIALERCLTEFFQGGLDHATSTKFSPLVLNPADTRNDLANYHSIISTGRGQFPMNLFEGEPSYDLNESVRDDFKSIGEKLEYSLKVIRDMGLEDVYVRDNSYLGICSHHIIVPGLSECFMIDDVYERKLRRPRRPTELMTKLESLDDEGLDDLIFDMESYTIVGRRIFNLPLEAWYSIPTDGNPNWKKITVELMLSLLYCRKGDYEKARENLEHYIKYLQANYPKVDLGYHRCVRDYYGLKQQGLDTEAMRPILSMAHSEEDISMVFEDFQDVTKIFQYLSIPTCFDCDKCPLAESCRYEVIKNIYLTTKKNQKKAGIDQKDLFETLKPWISPGT